MPKECRAAAIVRTMLGDEYESPPTGDHNSVEVSLADGSVLILTIREPGVKPRALH
jgi:hypothetical protein